MGPSPKRLGRHRNAIWRKPRLSRPSRTGNTRSLRSVICSHARRPHPRLPGHQSRFFVINVKEDLEDDTRTKFEPAPSSRSRRRLGVKTISGPDTPSVFPLYLANRLAHRTERPLQRTATSSSTSLQHRECAPIVALGFRVSNFY